MGARPVNWVVVQNEGRTGKCLRCGAEASVVLPMPVGMWIAAMKEFVKLHKRCKEKG